MLGRRGYRSLGDEGSLGGTGMSAWFLSTHPPFEHSKAEIAHKKAPSMLSYKELVDSWLGRGLGCDTGSFSFQHV